MISDTQTIEVEISGLRALHTLLWHIRDEMGNRRGKDRLGDAIKMVEDCMSGGDSPLITKLREGKAR